MKTGLGRITENTPKYNGVIVYTMNDVPLVRDDARAKKRIAHGLVLLGFWCGREIDR